MAEYLQDIFEKKKKLNILSDLHKGITCFTHLKKKKELQMEEKGWLS